jgi:hypothetical protein
MLFQMLEALIMQDIYIYILVTDSKYSLLERLINNSIDWIS